MQRWHAVVCPFLNPHPVFNKPVRSLTLAFLPCCDSRVLVQLRSCPPIRLGRHQGRTARFRVAQEGIRLQNSHRRSIRERDRSACCGRVRDGRRHLGSGQVFPARVRFPFCSLSNPERGSFYHALADLDTLACHLFSQVGVQEGTSAIQRLPSTPFCFDGVLTSSSCCPHPQDSDKALSYFLVGARLGDEEAMLAAARCLEAKKRKQDAAFWYRSAAAVSPGTSVPAWAYKKKYFRSRPST